MNSAYGDGVSCVVAVAASPGLCFCVLRIRIRPSVRVVREQIHRSEPGKGEGGQRDGAITEGRLSGTVILGATYVVVGYID